jgi:hypothetical protein
MRKLLLVCLVMLTLSSGSQACAQVHKGMYRLGLTADIATRGEYSRSSMKFSLGDFLTDNFELDFGMELLFVDGLSNGAGLFRGGLIYHILPDRKNVPGIGFSLGLPFASGNTRNSTMLNAYFKYDFFVSRDWAFSMQAGYEREFIENYPKTVHGLAAKFGVSTFFGRKE